MWELIEPHLLTIVITGLGLLFAWITRKGWLKKDLSESLHLDVQGAVTSVYHEYVKARKDLSEDGKLTEEEKKEARSLAIKKLGEVGKEKGLDYAKTYGIPLVLGLIEKYVTQNKNPEKSE